VIIWIDNDLVSTMERLMKGENTSRSYLARMRRQVLREIQQEKSKVPYTIWLREHKERKHGKKIRDPSKATEGHDSGRTNGEGEGNKEDKNRDKASSKAGDKKGSGSRSKEGPKGTIPGTGKRTPRRRR